jgi:hypothetical protein
MWATSLVLSFLDAPNPCCRNPPLLINFDSFLSWSNVVKINENEEVIAFDPVFGP